MKRKIALSLVAILGTSAFAGGGHPDLYASKGCHQEYNGYWGIGAGWNRDHNKFKSEVRELINDRTLASFSAKDHKSTGVGHIFLGYSFYNDMPYSVAIESGMFSSGKEVSKTKVATMAAAVQASDYKVIRGKAKREPAYYLALKPRYNSGDWWFNATVGVAATSYSLSSYSYNGSTLASAVPANLQSQVKDGLNTYGWMLGLGVGMWFTPNWAVSLDYDYMNFRKESSSTYVGYSAGVASNELLNSVQDGASSHFLTLNLKNNFNWFA